MTDDIGVSTRAGSDGASTDDTGALTIDVVRNFTFRNAELDVLKPTFRTRNAELDARNTTCWTRNAELDEQNYWITKPVPDAFKLVSTHPDLNEMSKFQL